MRSLALALIVLASTHLNAASHRKAVIQCGKDLACCMENPPSQTDCCTPGHVCPVRKEVR